MTVSNTRPTEGEPRVTLFGRLDDGTYTAEVMGESDVPYWDRWNNELGQVMVYIEPDPAQLKAIVAALNDGRLDYATLQNYGAANGGTSTLPID